MAKNNINIDLKCFEDLSKNLNKCADALRIFINAMEPYKTQDKTDDGWYAVLENGICVPGSELKYVVVRIRNIFTGRLSDIPHIAEYRNGIWWDTQFDKPYGSDDLPFHVDYWKPI